MKTGLFNVYPYINMRAAEVLRKDFQKSLQIMKKYDKMVKNFFDI